MGERRVAVLIDGDNVVSRHSRTVLSEAEKLGRVDVARVYVDENHLSAWLRTPGFRLMHAGLGKNATDLLLCIDAMELAFAIGIEAFAIATSDRDYTHLAQRLRERGFHVLGLGESKTPDEFRQACTAFLLLNGDERDPASTETISSVPEFDRKIRSMIAQHSKNGQGMLVSQLAPKMHTAHGTRISALPEGSWRAYLSARPDLYDLDPRGPEAMVRFRPTGFAAS
ncbi:NYN domain-containing protein [Limimaricola litoreus]|uniref:NYN domain-containing protein n=1 Tax=Limimaricola litoreus TaxID=2955316 RepID=A0A9X2FP90_9RHOB|nr:NYN domain-containing protein [Limimaricola litoreus]MCP1168919.1 NYN domain-containing protein [Limimaricola litoreus]